MTTTTELVPATPPPESVLIKTDVRGRMKHTHEQRERILDEFEHSGLSGPKFAALCGVKYQTFATWRHSRKQRRSLHPKRRSGRRAKATARVQWLEASVQPAAPSAGAGLMLHLSGGARAEITHPQHIGLAAALVRALEKPC